MERTACWNATWSEEKEPCQSMTLQLSTLINNIQCRFSTLTFSIWLYISHHRFFNSIESLFQIILHRGDSTRADFTTNKQRQPVNIYLHVARDGEWKANEL